MYKIPVKIDGIERRKRSTGLLHVVAGFFLMANAGTYSRLMNFENLGVVLPIYAIAVLSLVYGFFRKRFDPLARYNHWIRMVQFLCFALLTILFMDVAKAPQVIGLALWSAVTLFLMFTERKVFHDAHLHVKADGIHVPGYLKVNVVPWPIIESLVVRSDYVTILRRDQKYVQLEVLHDLCLQDIEQINQYSQKQIEQYAPKTV